MYLRLVRNVFSQIKNLAEIFINTAVLPQLYSSVYETGLSYIKQTPVYDFGKKFKKIIAIGSQKKDGKPDVESLLLLLSALGAECLDLFASKLFVHNKADHLEHVVLFNRDLLSVSKIQKFGLLLGANLIFGLTKNKLYNAYGMGHVYN